MIATKAERHLADSALSLRLRASTSAVGPLALGHRAGVLSLLHSKASGFRLRMLRRSECPQLKGSGRRYPPAEVVDDNRELRCAGKGAEVATLARRPFANSAASTWTRTSGSSM